MHYCSNAPLNIVRGRTLVWPDLRQDLREVIQSNTFLSNSISEKYNLSASSLCQRVGSDPEYLGGRVETQYMNTNVAIIAGHIAASSHVGLH